MVMGRGESKFELIMLFDRLNLEPKKMHSFLIKKGQKYSYWTLKKYYGHYNIAKNVAEAIIRD